MNRPISTPQILEPLPARDPVPGLDQEPWKAYVLTVVTLGVYGLVHHYRLNRELRDFGVDVDPIKSALAFFPGAILLVPYLITLYRTGERVAVAQETSTLTPTAGMAQPSGRARLVLIGPIPPSRAEQCVALGCSDA